MSSDTYRISATRIAPTTLSLTCETTTAIGPNDMATSRSFVLLALYLAMPPSAPLYAALDALGFGAGMVEEDFHRQHVGAFIAWTRLVRRENIVNDIATRTKCLDELRAREASGDAPPEFDVLEELWKQYPPHRYILEVRVTDPRWLEGLPDWFATTAYDVWTSDSAMDSAPDLVRAPWTNGALHGFSVTGAVFKDLGASSDGRRIFARVCHDYDPASAAEGWVAPPWTGAAVIFNVETLAEEARLELGPLLLRDRQKPGSLEFTRFSPRGTEVWLNSGSTAGLYLLEPERVGERADVAHCTSAGFFSDIAFDAASGDSALVSNGEEVETRHAHTEWPGVHATHAVMDGERIAAVGPSNLCVYDRRARAERFRIKVGRSRLVALLPEGRTAAIAGPYQSAQLRIFDRDGQLENAFKMKFAGAMKSSPSGLVAILVSETLLVLDLAVPRAVVVTEEPVREVVWLDDTRLVVTRGDSRGIAVLDVRAALSSGRAVNLEKPAAKKPLAKKSEEDG